MAGRQPTKGSKRRRGRSRYGTCTVDAGSRSGCNGSGPYRLAPRVPGRASMAISTTPTTKVARVQGIWSNQNTARTKE